MSLRYVIRRLGVFVLVIWAAATVNFIIPRLSPADPIKEALLRVTTMGAGQANMDVLAKTTIDQKPRRLARKFCQRRRLSGVRRRRRLMRCVLQNRSGDRPARTSDR